jgi:hypothetical protein
MLVLREEIQRDCREAAHRILRDEGQAAAQNEHGKEEMMLRQLFNSAQTDYIQQTYIILLVWKSANHFQASRRGERQKGGI